MLFQDFYNLIKQQSSKFKKYLKLIYYLSLYVCSAICFGNVDTIIWLHNELKVIIMHIHSVNYQLLKLFNWRYPPGGSEWIISVGDYVDNSFTALGSSDPQGS